MTLGVSTLAASAAIRLGMISAPNCHAQRSEASVPTTRRRILRLQAQNDRGLRVGERLQLFAPTGVAQLAERLRLDLADTLPGHAQLEADLVQRVLATVVQPIAEIQDAALAGTERLEHLG